MNEPEQKILEIMKLSSYEDEILDLIEIQLLDNENSLTQSDLQGAVGALVRKIRG